MYDAFMDMLIIIGMSDFIVGMYDFTISHFLCFILRLIYGCHTGPLCMSPHIIKPVRFDTAAVFSCSHHPTVFFTCWFSTLLTWCFSEGDS